MSGEPICVLDTDKGKITNTWTYGCSYSETCWLDISGKVVVYERYEGGTKAWVGGQWVEVYPEGDLNGNGADGDCAAGWVRFQSASVAEG